MTATTVSWCSPRLPERRWVTDAERHVFDAVDPAKDVDGFNPVNVGRLVQKRSLRWLPCTPSGIIELLGPQ